MPFFNNRMIASVSWLIADQQKHKLKMIRLIIDPKNMIGMLAWHAPISQTKLARGKGVT